MTYPHPDPYDAAIQAKPVEYSNDIYGQIEFDTWFCVLQKGVGKVVFDDQMHRPGDRRTAITINISDVSGVNYRREFIAEIATDGWLKITLPSLRAAGVTNLRKFSGSWIHAVMEPFGKYTDADGNEKQRTAPKIVAVFKNESEAKNAAQGAPIQADFLDPHQAINTQLSGNGASTPDNSAERQVALSFLPAIVKGCVVGNGIDSQKLAATLKSNPILARYFDLSSPEVAQAMAAALSELAF